MSKKSVTLPVVKLGGKPVVKDGKSYEKAVRYYDKHFAAEKLHPLPLWYSVGDVRQVMPYERGVRLACEYGWVELHWLEDDCLRVRLRFGDADFLPPFSYAVSKVDWPKVGFELTDSKESLEMRTAAVVCHVSKRPLRLALETLDGELVCKTADGLLWREDGAVRLSLALYPDEACYGLGERAVGLNLRGKAFQLWNADPEPRPFQRGHDPLYYSVPFYLGVHERSAYGVLWDNSCRGVADLGASHDDELAFEAESGELRCYFFAGGTVNQVLSRYTELTGRIKLPPLWGLGYHQCRWSYFPQDVVLDLAHEFRTRQIPCDAIYLDIDYMDGYRIFTWNRERFPEFPRMIADLHEQGFKVVTILDPGIKVDEDYDVHKSGLARDLFLKYPDGEPVAAEVWPGVCHFPDFTNPAARSWWGEYCNRLLKVGIDGFWNDMCEPSVFTPHGATTLPDYVYHDKDGIGGDHLENHNVYGMLMGRASAEALEKHRPRMRLFNIIRAGFAGAQRYASTWTGDNVSDWDHLRLSLSMVINMGLSGAPMTGPDIGGFFNAPDGELFVRWLQAACLFPFYRVHTAMGTPPQEPWSYGEKVEQISRETIRLRYQLLPYLYSVVAECKEYGWPVIRPLFMAEPDNPELRSMDDAYLVGNAVLVAPILERGATQRSVYLPKGQWYDFWTNRLLPGGREHQINAPLERLPLFVRAGSVLPLWPDLLYVGEKTFDTLTMRVYPGAEFETVLYEDRGEGLDYERGDYRWVYMTCSWDDNVLVIKRRAAGSYEPSYSHIRLEVLGFSEAPVSVRVDRLGAPVWYYDDNLLELTIQPFGLVEITRTVHPDDPTIAHRSW